MAEVGKARRASWVGWLWILSGVLLISSAIAYGWSAATEDVGALYVALAVVWGACGVTNVLIGLRQRRAATRD